MKDEGLPTRLAPTRSARRGLRGNLTTDQVERSRVIAMLVMYILFSGESSLNGTICPVWPWYG